MRLQMIVLETQSRLDEKGLEDHVKQLRQMIEEQTQGAPMGVQTITLSTTALGDQIRYSSIAAVSIGDVPESQEPVLGRSL